MLIRKIIYAFVLIATFVFYIMYHPWLSWYLFVLVLLVIPFDLLLSLPGMLTKTVVLSTPSFLEKDTHAVATITSVHLKSFPFKGLGAKLRVTGDDLNVTCRISVGSENNDRNEVIIDTSRTGVTVFELKNANAVSLVGLFSLPIKVRCRSSVLILPPPVAPASTLFLPRGISLQAKPGGGFSEEHDMRNYRIGDPVRSIHWKLSAKLNSLIIREPLVPPPHSRLIQISQWNDKAERDIILGRLRWTCEHLLAHNMAFYIKFARQNDIAEITTISDFHEFLHTALDTALPKKIMSQETPSHFSWIHTVSADT